METTKAMIIRKGNMIIRKANGRGLLISCPER
jgi:hypothetical protein